MNNIDDIDRYSIQGPIFQILAKHLDEEKLKDIFIDIGKKDFLKDLPKHFLDDISFLKRCAEKSIINIFEFPKKYQKPEFIPKELYIEQLKFFKLDLSYKQIYPQDEEIALRFLQLSLAFYELVEPKFKEDCSLLYNAFLENIYLFTVLPQNLKNEIFSNNNKIDEIISKNVAAIEFFPKEQASRKEVIYSVLEHPSITDEYKINLLKPHIKFNQEPDVVLKVLEKLPTMHKYLNQKYVSIFQMNSIKSNHYNFLKIYLFNEQLDKNLDTKENSNKQFKI